MKIKLTKEQFYFKHADKNNIATFSAPTYWELDAMEEYKDQEISGLKLRYDELNRKYNKMKSMFEDILSNDILTKAGLK